MIANEDSSGTLGDGEFESFEATSGEGLVAD
jgi:hypothetical protein